ncbi:hypothetical protein [Rhizobium sophoriradicis]|uniref:Uncharacterized protein n=1 Tax=Rhizobium sophoriradicis TaxID=1535245 RepID=A0A2A5KKV7_9HYPH|nr:hypothetical protein [Rhizobium sophoriradicis]PCK77680.1 hypothetical protein CPT34_28715 [Rhizobium sophoriradicis]
MQALLDRLEAISKILLILGTLIGGVWGIYQYFERLQEQRVAMTLDYVRRLNSEQLLASQTQLSAAWYGVRDKLRLVRETPVAFREIYVARQRQLVMSVMAGSSAASSGEGRTSLVSALDLLEGFFSELRICVDSNICDPKTARTYFGSYAKRLYCLHEPFIRYKDKTFSDGYGAALRSFSLSGSAVCTP